MRHCRICYNTGHNRRTCPQANAAQKSAYQDKTAIKRRSGSRCSYCNRYKYITDRSHNRRNCPEKQKDAVAWTANNAPAAKRIAEELPKYGIGFGAIVSKSYERQRDVYYIVTGINWDSISGDNIHGAFSAVRLSEQDHDDSWNVRNFELPKMEGVDATTYSDTVVVNPISADAVKAQIPSDFELGYYGMPDHMRTTPRKKRRR